jgi:hypothetical protein
MRRGATSKQGARSARSDRRHVSGLDARCGMPDTENTAMKGEQSPTREPGPNLRQCYAGAKKLLAGNHSV